MQRFAISLGGRGIGPNRSRASRVCNRGTLLLKLSSVPPSRACIESLGEGFMKGFMIGLLPYRFGSSVDFGSRHAIRILLPGRLDSTPFRSPVLMRFPGVSGAQDGRGDRL